MVRGVAGVDRPSRFDFFAGEFDGVGFVAGGVEQFEFHFGTGGAANHFHTVFEGFAFGDDAIDFADEEAFGESGPGRG